MRDRYPEPLRVFLPFVNSSSDALTLIRLLRNVNKLSYVFYTGEIGRRLTFREILRPAGSLLF